MWAQAVLLLVHDLQDDHSISTEQTSCVRIEDGAKGSCGPA